MRDSAPAGRRFQVVVHPVNWDGSSRVIHGTGTATVSGQTVTVTLASAVEQGETALATYRKGDEANPLRDAAGTKPEVESFGLTVATVMDRTTPKLHSAASSRQPHLPVLQREAGHELDAAQDCLHGDPLAGVPRQCPQSRCWRTRSA